MAEQNGEPGDMVTCPTCAKIWPQGTRFCTLCGTWIQSGKVIDPATSQSPQGGSAIGSSPPGIAPRRPTQPGIGSSPPGIAPTHSGFGVPQSRFDAVPPGVGGPAQPGPGEEPLQGPGEGSPPQKKYAFKIEPPRQEHVPQGPLFLPDRGPKKKKSGIKPSQIPIAVICILVAAYAVISIAFKPMHSYLLGLFFDKINRTESAIKHYQKATTYWTSSWAKSASKALNKIGRRVFGAHLDRQFYKSWTATSKITVTIGGKPVSLTSTLAFKPGFFVEDISQDGKPVGKRLLNSTVYSYQLGSSRSQVSAEAYAQQMQQVAGFGPDKLFAESGKEETLNAFFDDDKLQMKFDGIEDDDAAGKVYVFSISLAGNEPHKQLLGVLSGPFFDWPGASRNQQIATVKYSIRVEDGFLARAEFTDPNGAVVVVQNFADFNSGADIPESRFAH